MGRDRESAALPALDSFFRAVRARHSFPAPRRGGPPNPCEPNRRAVDNLFAVAWEIVHNQGTQTLISMPFLLVCAAVHVFCDRSYLITRT